MSIQNKIYYWSPFISSVATVEAVIKSVDSEILPELDDKLAEEFGVTKGGIEKLKADVTANMHREVEQRIAQDIKEQVMNSLLSSNDIEIDVRSIRDRLRDAFCNRIRHTSKFFFST